MRDIGEIEKQIEKQAGETEEVETQGWIQKEERKEARGGKAEMEIERHRDRDGKKERKGETERDTETERRMEKRQEETQRGRGMGKKREQPQSPVWHSPGRRGWRPTCQGPCL